MTKHITEKQFKKITNLPHFDTYYEDGKSSYPKEYEDDCFIHISRGKYRFVFYNGQADGALIERHVKKYKKLVDNILK